MLPKRGVIAIVTTALGLALLLSFRTSPAPGLARGAGVAAVGSAAGPASVPAASAAAPADASQPSLQPDAGGPATGSTPTATPAPAAAAKANGTVMGQPVDTPYGTVQVQVTFTGGRIADVQAIQLPVDRMRSAMISRSVAPLLRTEALSAQNARIDLVSGATYTSEGYAESLQSAIDQAHG
jgi:uncharacterized protein with FMN-binding domain